MITVGPDPQIWGFIPGFLDEQDPRPAREQFNEHYPGGWMPAPEWLKFSRKTLRLTYPGDPPLQPIGLIQFRDEMIFLYPSSWVCIVQPNGKWEVARMD